MKLETQLRAYFEEFDATLEPLEVEQVTLQQVPGRQPPTMRRAVPGWAVAVAAFVTLLIAIGGAGLLFNRDVDETTPVTEPTTTTLVTTTIPSTTAPVTTAPPASTTVAPEPIPAPSVSQAPITWRRIEDTDATRFQDSPIEAITAGGPGFIAVGTEQAATADGGFAVDAVVWVSPDGETWERIDSPVFGAGAAELGDRIGQLGTQWMSEVVTNGDRIIAVGYEDYAAAVWTSVDGYTWERVVDDDLPPGTTDSYMDAVATYEGGFIAVGRHRGDAAVWLSPDGLDWTEVVNDDLRGDSDGQVSLEDVAAFDGGFVAVGDKGWANPGEGTETYELFLAFSQDGRNWERVPVVDELSGDLGLVLPPDMAERTMDGVAVVATEDRLFVSAAVGVGDGALFASEDGRSWQAVPVPEGPVQHFLGVWGDYLTTSLVTFDNGPRAAVRLTSGDMTEWLVAAIDEPAVFQTLVPLGSRLLAGGVYLGEDGEDFRGGIWIGTWDG